MQNKLQKHQAFEVELSANKGRVDSVSSAGEKLVNSDHYASDEIKNRIESLQELWKNLLASSADKRNYLSKKILSFFTKFCRAKASGSQRAATV